MELTAREWTVEVCRVGGTKRRGLESFVPWFLTAAQALKSLEWRHLDLLPSDKAETGDEGRVCAA